MTTIIRTDRSRCETAQRCLRARWLGYHQDGMGITSARKPLPLAVGGAVHEGLAHLLTQAVNQPYGKTMIHDTVVYEFDEDAAVAAALADFSAFDAGRLEADTSELAAMDLSTLDEAARERVRSEVDQYLYDEQRALVEAMVRAYARRRLRPLLDEYEVLEVEREGEWELSRGRNNPRIDRDLAMPHTYGDIQWDEYELRFMSRPDALLRNRQTNDLYIQSFKTGASWDFRKGREAEHDAQGLSEGVEIEKRLATWWGIVQRAPKVAIDQTLALKDANLGGEGELIPDTMVRFLRGLSSPPRILGIRYEFLWKGKRWEDKDLTKRFGVTTYAQKSPLVRGYVNAGMTAGDEQWNWSWDYLKEGGETSKLYWKAWRGAAVWESMPVARWIDMLDATVLTTGEEGREVGWSGPAQATGFTAGHPLDEVFHPPIIVYRGEDDLRDWIESTEAQEVRIAENVARVGAARDDGERRSLLNVLFPMTRSACVYPSMCQFAGDKNRVGVCYAAEHVKAAPLASGEYRVREPNHPQEKGEPQ